MRTRFLVFAMFFLICGATRAESDRFRQILNTQSSSDFVSVSDADLAGSSLVLARTFRISGGTSVLWRDAQYAVSCSGPSRRVGLVEARYNASNPGEPESWRVFRADAASGVDMKDLTEWRTNIPAEVAGVPLLEELIASYGCGGSNASETARQRLAAALEETGGATDLVKLTCDLTLRNGVSHTVPLHFSEQRGFVRWRGFWRAAARVSEDEIKFAERVGSDAATVSVDRRSGALSISLPGLGRIGQGGCTPESSTQRKF